jgi:hypothetical protein
VTRPTKKPAQHVLDHYREQMSSFGMTRAEVAAALGCNAKTSVRWIPLQRPRGWPRGRPRAGRVKTSNPRVIAANPRRQAEAEKRARLAAELERMGGMR